MVTGTDANGLPTPSITTLPTGLTATAFVGIAWYLAIELNVRLIFTFTRRSLYFWSCLVCSSAIIIHNLAITLFNFQVWTDYSAVVVSTISWVLYVVPQSVVLYSRLGLVLKSAKDGRWVLYMIIVVSAIFGVGTVILALIARYPSNTERLGNANLIWDKVQLAAFFVQETIISLLYIRETRRYLHESAPAVANNRVRRHLLQHLIYVNIFIICLDCSLIGLCYAGFFFLQGHYKVAVYAIKLRTEFTILNELRSSVAYSTRSRHAYGGQEDPAQNYIKSGSVGVREMRRGSQDSDIQMVTLHSQIMVETEIRVEEDLDKVESTRSRNGVSRSEDSAPMY